MIRNAFIKRTISAFSLVYSGTILGAVLNFVTQLTLARTMQMDDLGTVAALLSTLNFLGIVGLGGMDWFLWQVSGKEGDVAFRWYYPAAQLIACFTCASIAGLVAYAFILGNFTSFERFLLIICAIQMLLGQTAVGVSSVRYQIERRHSQVAIWQTVTQAGRAVAAISLKLFFMPDLRAVLVGYGLMGTVAAIWSALAVPSRGWLRLLKSRQYVHPSMLETAHEALPFLLIGALYLMFFQGPIVVLEYLRGGTETAQYNIAFLIVSATMLFPSVFYTKFIAAAIFQWGHHDRAKLAASFYLSAALMAMSGVLIMSIFEATAGWIVPRIFGWRYIPSVDLVLVMSLAIPLRFLQSAFSSLLVTRPQTISRVIYLGLGALTSMIASCAFIPAFGALGAAYATVLAELVLFLLSWRGLSLYAPEIRPLGWLNMKSIRKSITELSNR
jgi:O-antigen/teichoic acid export membrane protein